MTALTEQIDPPALGAVTTGLRGTMVRVPRNAGFQTDPNGCIRERRSILEWCAEQNIAIAKLDMAVRKRPETGELRHWARPDEMEWEVFVEGDPVAAVAFKLRWG